MTKNTTVTQLTVRSKRVDQSLWHRSGEEISLGCSRCPERSFCDGLSIRAGAFDCLAFCCGEPKTCRKYVCPHQKRYSTLVNEVGGFTLVPYRRPVTPMGALPEYVPFIFDAGNLNGPLPLTTVAISLYSIIDHRTGIAKFSSRAEMLERFKVNHDAHVS